LAPGCGRKGAKSAISLTVEIGAVKARCVRAFARSAKGAEFVSEPVSLESRPTVTVTIFSGPDLDGTIDVGARGYLGDSCDGDLILNEETAPILATFQDGELTHATIKLDRVAPEFDADNDGYRSAAFGGADCRDDAAVAYPGAQEVCDDGV